MTQQLPGFIDLQVNGYLGHDFGVDHPDGWHIACDGVLASGTAAFLPTVITAPISNYQNILPKLAACIQQKTYHKRIPGLHLEGPFLSAQAGAIGAHNPDFCQEADPAVLDQLQNWADGQIRLLTIAANIPGAAALCQHAVKMGIVVANGHSLATEDELKAFADAGGTALTHLGNALPNELNRFCNPLWAGLTNDQLSAMFISDGHHVSPALQKIILRCKGIQKSIVVSDASPIAGLAPGPYETLGNKVILEANGKLHNPDKHCLVGSSAMMIDCMNQLAALDILSYDELLDLGIYNALELLQIDHSDVDLEPQLQFDNKTKRFSLLPAAASSL